jgi:hypothetical protein
MQIENARRTGSLVSARIDRLNIPLNAGIIIIVIPSRRASAAAALQCERLSIAVQDRPIFVW